MLFRRIRDTPCGSGFELERLNTAHHGSVRIETNQPCNLNASFECFCIGSSVTPRYIHVLRWKDFVGRVVELSNGLCFSVPTRDVLGVGYLITICKSPEYPTSYGSIYYRGRAKRTLGRNHSNPFVDKEELVHNHWFTGMYQYRYRCAYSPARIAVSTRLEYLWFPPYLCL